MKYRGIFEYDYPVEHKPPVGIDVYLHGDCVKGKIIEWEYRSPEQEPFMATPCISSKVCEHDRVVTLDRIRAEIDGLKKDSLISWASSEMIISTILNIINKYKAEREK